MITPRFKLSQNDNFLTINIRAPYCNLSELEIDVEENAFLFLCRPYYLRLRLPGHILNDDRCKSAFDTDSGEFCLVYPKKQAGEHFKDLDLITTLLVPKVEVSYSEGTIPIEVLDESNTETVSSELHTNNDYGYGFALRGSKDFMPICSEFEEVFEINPCKVSLPERRKLRMQYEQGKFNIDHYLADYIDNDAICEIMAQKCPYVDLPFNFTDKELDFLKDLPNVKYDLSTQQLTFCHNGLLDILFAYCYDQRTTQFEGNSESSWNISKLAATLCWSEGFETPRDAIVSAFRRTMIYPLYRHFDLAQMVFDDLKALISLEEKHVVRVLIQIYDLFLHGDRYILNNLFIKDYIVYIMKWDKDLWRSTVKAVNELKIKKDDVGLNLDQIEESLIPTASLAAMRITEDDVDSDDCESTSSSECSSDDSSSSSSSSSSSESDFNDSDLKKVKDSSKYICIY